MRLFLTLTGVSLIVAGLAYLLFLHAAVGLTGIELPGAAAAIDARATYGGTQVGLGLFLLWCRSREAAMRPGLVLVFLIGACLALSRLSGFAIDGEFDRFNLAGTAAEIGLATIAGLLLQRDRRDAETETKGAS